MKNKLFICLVSVFLICLAATNVFADDQTADVEITTDLEGIQTDALIKGNAEITFNDMSLYNENIKFSYHIYDESGNDVLFENPRVPVVLDGNSAVIPFEIDKLTIPEIAQHDKFIIKLDMVDEENIFWFSLNSYISYKGAVIECENIVGENVVLGNAVTIKTDIDSMQTTNVISGNVMVTFENMAYYNEGIKLSYHIYGKDGEEIAYENERTPVVISEGNSVVIPFELDKTKISSISGLKDFQLKFDLVDEQNMFWFSKAENIQYEPHGLPRRAQPYGFPQWLHQKFYP